MSPKICGGCAHFRQHYVKFGYRYNDIDCGHCVFPRLKHRDATAAACEYFKERKREKKDCTD
ncbi:MAG: hypothetical protein FWF49_00585 [Oscillospiraceae bacterium]|nr:hypothetical protein [Oscillospiraceae bacterium]